MRRRDFISLAGSAVAVWPLVAHAQRSATPVVGFLRSTTPEPFQHIVTAFREGLNEAGFVEGQNVTVEYRWTNNRLDHLPGLAADLVRRQVAVIVGNSLAVEAAKAVTSTTPIVFVTADDPVKSGFVNSLGRPGGNLTGVTFFGGGRLGAKRAELLHELVPTTAAMAVLLGPNYPGFQAELPDVQATIRALGRKAVVVEAANGREFDAAFARTVDAGADALLVGGSPVFTGRRRELVELAARHAVPAVYDQRDYVAAGGLISYGASFTGAYRQAGIYAGRILKGAKPSELPDLQPTTFELVVNLKTAKALDLDVPQSITLRADEVIE